MEEKFEDMIEELVEEHFDDVSQEDFQFLYELLLGSPEVLEEDEKSRVINIYERTIGYGIERGNATGNNESV